MKTSLDINDVWVHLTLWDVLCSKKWLFIQKYLLILLFAVALVSCGDDNEDGGPSGPTLEVTELTDDVIPKKSKTWQWNCNQGGCLYRFKINQSSAAYRFAPRDPYTSQSTVTKASGDGKYYIHVQAMQEETELTSEVKTVMAILDNTPPLPPSSRFFTVPKASKDTTPDIAVSGLDGGEFVEIFSDGQCSTSVGGGKAGPRQTSMQLSLEEITTEGKHKYYAKFTDLAGNVGRCSLGSVFTYTLDTTEPEVTGLENDTTPRGSKRWQWGCNEEDCTYRYIVNQEPPPYTFPQEEPYQADTSAEISTGNGTYYLHVQARDIAGNESLVRSVSTTIDGSKPGVINLANEATPKKSHTWSWGCNKSSCTYRYKISTSSVYHFTNEAFTAQATASTGANLNGLYYIHVQAKDVTGNLSVVAKASVILDNQAPSAPSSLSVLTPRGHNTTPEVTVNGVSPGDTVNLYLNSRCTGAVQGRQVVPGSATSVKIVPSVALTSQGDYKYYAQSRDIAGNVSPCSTSYASYTLDLTNLRVTQLTDDSTPKRTKEWTWSCNNLPCTYRHAINKNSSHTFTGSNFLSTPPVQTQNGLNGKHYIHVQAKDQRGNISPVQTAFAILDNIPPLAPSSLIASGSTNRDNTPSVRVSGVSAGDTVTIHFNDPTCNSHSVAGSGTVPANTSRVDIEAQRIDATASGTFYYYATTTDRAGNKSICSTASARYDLHITVVNPPTGLAINSERGTSRTPSITVSGGDVQTGYTVNIYTDNQCQTNNKVGSEIANGNAVVVTVNSLTRIGRYTFYANLAHPDGSLSSCSTASVNYELYEAILAPTTLSVNPTSGGSITVVTVSGGGVKAGNTVHIYTNSTCTSQNIASQQATGSSVAITVSNLSNPGTYNFYSKVTHPDGRSSPCSTAKVAYTVLPPPLLSPTVVTVNSLAGTNPNPEVTVSGGGVATGTIVSIYSDAVCTKKVGSGTAFSNSVRVALSTPLSPGTHFLYATVKNAMNQAESACSTAFAQYILYKSQLAAPTSISITPTNGSDPTPDVIVSGGDVAQGVDVSIYTDSACSLSNKIKTASSGGSTARITLDTLTPNVAYTFYATIENPNVNNKSACSSARVGYTYRFTGGPTTPVTGGPNRLTFVGTSQNEQTKLSLEDSPSIRAHNISGGQTISVYNSKNCSGTPLASVRVPNYITNSYVVTLSPLTETGTYTFSVATSAGTGRQCSEETLTYVFYKPLATGGKHTCYLLTDGGIRCWGENGKGQLGGGSRTSDISLGTYDHDGDGGTTPEIDYTAKVIAAGGEHTCAILNTDEVKCWGLNDSGQLGQNNKTDASTPPAPIVFKNTDYRAKAIATGEKHTCIIIKHENNSGTPQTDDGKVLCWGDNAFGQLGQDDIKNYGIGDSGEVDDQSNPINYNVNEIDPIRLGSSSGLKAKMIAAGGYHTCAILESDGQVMCWGKNEFGQLGLRSTQNQGDQTNEMRTLSRINLGGGRRAQSIVAGGNHTCVLLDNDTVKCWGLNTSGQLGQNDTNNYGGRSTDTIASLSAIGLGSSYTAKAIDAGDNHTCVVLNNDQIKCFGENEAGQLGQNDMHDHGSGRLQTDDVDDLNPIALGCGNATGGSGASSLDEDGNCADNYQPFSSKIMATGGAHTCSVLVTSHVNTLDNNSLKCWGLNDAGQLGQGDTVNHGSGEDGTTNVDALDTVVFN